MLEMARALGRMQAANDALKAQVRQNSENSHRPPSTDPPDAKDKPKAKPKGRMPGGQPGHKGTTRKLVPSEDVDKSFDIHPDHCGKCGGSGLLPTDSKPWRHQTWEIPETHPTVTEHRLHADLCPHCGTVTRAGLPEGVPSGSFGPRLMALVCLLHGRYRVSLRNIEEFLSDAFGVEVSLGSLKNMEDKVSEALAPPVEELHEAVKASDVPANADETSWREKGKRLYLWAVVVPFAAVYLVRRSRAAKVAKELLGTVHRVVVTDRYKGYDWIPLWFRQPCLAHLRRDARKMEGRGGDATRIGAGFGAAIDEIFHFWHRVKAGTLARSTFCKKISPIRRLIEGLLLYGTTVPSIAGRCREIL
ncbi:MAG: IS66 family transposase, partial [Candidatus Eisenbacteria bacterium]|nr:IS66 family transposase [Candidatus Latescibacterota bacterium]MBD3334498.1 IS66 family transposase [Candidatus Eisenbacteria bacterium]